MVDVAPRPTPYNHGLPPPPPVINPASGNGVVEEKAKANFQTARFRLLAWARSQGKVEGEDHPAMPPMVPQRTLRTFFLIAPPKTQSVQMLGSWNGFSERHSLERDQRRGRYYWKTSALLSDALTLIPNDSLSASEPGGLVMGVRYYYFFLLNHDIEFFDPTCDTTSTCPLMPGQLLNYVDIPIELPPTTDEPDLIDAPLAQGPHLKAPTEPTLPPPPIPAIRSLSFPSTNFDSYPMEAAQSLAPPSAHSQHRKTLTAPAAPPITMPNKRLKSSETMTPVITRLRSTRSSYSRRRKHSANVAHWSPLEPPPIPPAMLSEACRRKPYPLFLRSLCRDKSTSAVSPAFKSAPLLPLAGEEDALCFAPPETSASMPPSMFPAPPHTTIDRIRISRPMLADRASTSPPPEHVEEQTAPSDTEPEQIEVIPNTDYLKPLDSHGLATHPSGGSYTYSLPSPASACFTTSAMSTADQSPYQPPMDISHHYQNVTMSEVLDVDTKPGIPVKSECQDYPVPVNPSVQNALDSMDGMFDDLAYLGSSIL